MTTGERSHALHTVDLHLHPNEASDLLPVEADRLLRARGWDVAFWMASTRAPSRTPSRSSATPVEPAPRRTRVGFVGE